MTLKAAKAEGSPSKFLLISRILWDKGIAEFIKASRILKNKYKNINFQLLGPIENEISSEISLKQIKLPTLNIKLFNQQMFLRTEVDQYLQKIARSVTLHQ